MTVKKAIEIIRDHVKCYDEDIIRVSKLSDNFYNKHVNTDLLSDNTQKMIMELVSSVTEIINERSKEQIECYNEILEELEPRKKLKTKNLICPPD